MSTRTYLPLDDKHAVPLNNLTVDGIKEAAAAIICGPATEQGIKRTTTMNFIIKAMGLRGNMGQYKSEHYPAIEAFLDHHGLSTPRDLFSGPPFRVSFVFSVTRQQVADRIFNGDPQLMIERVFTGYNLDTFDLSERCRGLDEAVPGATRPGTSPFTSKEVAADLALARSDPAALPELAYKWRLFTLGFGNYLGDSLVGPALQPAFNQIYEGGTGRADPYNEQIYLDVYEIIRTFLDSQPAGWVKILRFTDDLVFLAGPDGEYDFLVRNQREAPPPLQFPDDKGIHVLSPDDSDQHDLQVGRVDDTDCPTAMRDIGRSLWDYYFSKDAFEEKDRHEAETHYYANGGRAEFYPGPDAILRDYLIHAERYTRPVNKRAEQREGFTAIETPWGTAYCSQLITIELFEEFLKDSGYIERRPVPGPYSRSPDWSAGNSDPGELPVACSWYEAVAYCAWRERHDNVPYRLLTVREYRIAREMGMQVRVDGDFSPAIDPACATQVPTHMQRRGGKEEVLATRPAFMGIARFLPQDQIPWSVAANGLPFIESRDFYEWTMEDDPQRLTSPDATFIGARGIWLLDQDKHDWGAYRGIKIGFRICYE